MSAPDHVLRAVDEEVILNAVKQRPPRQPPPRDRNAELADVARAKVMGSRGADVDAVEIGNLFHFHGEVVAQQWTEAFMMPHGKVEDVYVTVTEIPGAPVFDREGKRRSRSGRVLFSYNPEGTVAYGGLFYVEYHGRTCVNSVYVVPEYRGVGFARRAAEVVKSLGVDCVFAPVSADGRRWAERAGLALVED